MKKQKKNKITDPITEYIINVHFAPGHFFATSHFFLNFSDIKML